MGQTHLKKDQAIIDEAVENFRVASTTYSTQRRDARADLAFLAGEQRPSGVDEFNKVNLLQPYLRQILSSAREANPSINVVPVAQDDLALASVYEGIIRSIWQKCDADQAAMTALWYAAAAGEGYILLDTEYVSPDSFDQEYVIRAADNPEMIFLDPNHRLLDGCDAEWGFIVEEMSHSEFKRKFPKSALAKKLSGGTQGWQQLSLPGDWMNEKSVRVAKYYVKHYEDKKIFLYEDAITGETITLEESPDVVIGTETEPGTNPTYIFLQRRVTQEITVKAYALTAYEVLDETIWPGKYLPIIKVTGDSYWVGGKRVQHGAIRFAKDPQKQVNFLLTRKTQLIDLIPKVPFVAANGQVVDNPDDWANAHRNAVGTLTYSPISLDGNLVPAPSRPQGIDVASFQAITQSIGESIEHLKLTFGNAGNALMDAAGNETSGVALQTRESSAGKSVYHYFDNLLVALRCIGRQLVEGIPIIYDTERMVRIVKPDNTDQIIAINSMQNRMRYDLSKGTYDVVVKTGPAYASKREKSLAAVAQVLPLLPEPQRAAVSDLMLRLVDDDATSRMADRIKAMQPPEVLAATGEGDDSDLAPAELVKQLQAQLAQLTQKIQVAELEKKELEVRVKVAEDKSLLELTKADLQHEQEMKKLQHADEVAEIEARIKMKQLELSEMELALKERELEHNRAQGHRASIGDVDVPGGHNIGTN